MKTFQPALFLLCFAFSLHGQKDVCGTSIEDQLGIEARQRLAGESQHKPILRGNTVYVPVKFHIVTKGDGTGGANHSAILNQLCRLNNDYKEWDIVFFPKDGTNYNYINSSTAYSDPRTAENFLNQRKDDSALNVFIVGDIGESQGGVGNVLGYYTPASDFIVIKISQLSNTSNTLSHEVGHFFSLRHTFYGWECDPYDPNKHGNPVTRLTAPCLQIPVEVMDKSNCTVAADELCDTPPEYLFAFSSVGSPCGLNTDVFDSNGDKIVTMADNHMGYFEGCSSYKFTNGQYMRILSNYNSGLRDYIRTNYVPNETVISGKPELITPALGSKEDMFNAIQFEWTAVANADHYLLEVEGEQTTFYYTDETQVFVTNLKANKDYFYRIYTFNDGYFCSESSRRGVFSTGSGTSSVSSIQQHFDFSINPNPANSMVRINCQSAKAAKVTIRLFGADGRILKHSNHKFETGQNIVDINTAELSEGLYFIRLASDEGYLTQKLTIVR